jgi:hypothetical protein
MRVRTHPASSTEVQGEPHKVGRASDKVLLRTYSNWIQRERINPSTGNPATRHEDTIDRGMKQKLYCSLCTEKKTLSRNDASTRHLRMSHPGVSICGRVGGTVVTSNCKASPIFSVQIVHRLQGDGYIQHDCGPTCNNTPETEVVGGRFGIEGWFAGGQMFGTVIAVHVEMLECF